MLTDKKGQFLLKSLKSVIIADSIVPVEKYSVCAQSIQTRLDFFHRHAFSGLAAKYHQNVVVILIPEPM